VAGRFHPGERVLYPFLWLIPAVGMVLNRLDRPVMPLLILLFGVMARSRLPGVAKVELPGATAAR
jgi:hypothetical protein